MDHVSPVVDPAVGWVSLDVFADRLLCDESGYQCICVTCHDAKTKGENQIRKQTRTEANLKKKLHTQAVRKRNPKVNKHTGGSLSDFLKECGIELDKDLDKSK